MPRSVRRVMEATMTPLLTVPVQGYEVCRPAAGTRAAFNSQDFGTSHWQLMIDGYTSFTRLQKGAAMAGAAQSITRHLLHRQPGIGGTADAGQAG